MGDGMYFVKILNFARSIFPFLRDRRFHYIVFFFLLQGQTGFPWIDAVMKQLRYEGWIHPLTRHSVVCFLTRGDLWISWEEGMRVFEQFLLDADWAVNAGTWMWLSCSAFFQHFFHCYCPVQFGRKADPNSEYIRRFLPVLKVSVVEEFWNQSNSNVNNIAL